MTDDGAIEPQFPTHEIGGIPAFVAIAADVELGQCRGDAVFTGRAYMGRDIEIFNFSRDAVGGGARERGTIRLSHLGFCVIAAVVKLSE